MTDEARRTEGLGLEPRNGTGWDVCWSSRFCRQFAIVKCVFHIQVEVLSGQLAIGVLDAGRF